jgi:NTE family protein
MSCSKTIFNRVHCYGTWLLLLIFVQFSPNLFGQNAAETRKFTLPSDTSIQYPLENLKFHSVKTLKVALVLSGGGARGFAHIGVLKALEENHIPVDLIVGSSIGSAVGGFYAAGYSAEQLIDIFHHIDWQNIFTDETYRRNLFWSQKSTPRQHILELRFDNAVPYIPPSLTPGQKVFDIIYTRLLKANFQAAYNFDNLKIPFRAVATDLISGERVVIKDGDLAEAISGSMAVPLLFAPVEWRGMWLADGGIKDNLPVDVALENKADVIIAVDVSSPLRTPEQIKSPWQLADQVTTIMMEEPTKESRQLADVVINPELHDYAAGDFSNLDSLIERGYKATQQKIRDIEDLVKSRLENIWGENVYLGKVGVVKITGLKKTRVDTQTNKLHTQAGYSFYVYDLYKDLLAFYHTGCISDAYVTTLGNPYDCQVEFHVKENPLIEEIKFNSNHIFSDSTLANIVKIPKQEVLNYNLLFKGLDSLIQMEVNSGYSLARVTNIKYDSLSQNLLISIDDGYINGIEIEGNHRTQDYIILRELTFHDKQILKAENALESLRNIYSTQLFDRVTINAKRHETGYRINIKVKEKKYFLMRLGGNVSLERKANGLLEFAEDNLFGREIKLYLTGTIGELERNAEARIYSVRLFNSYLTYRLSAYYHEREDRYYNNFNRLGNYLTIRRGIQFILGQQIERLGSITAELRWDRINVFSNDPFFSYTDHYQIRSLTIRSNVDKRDKLPFPDRGIYNRWYWETGNQKLLGSSIGFTRFFIALEGYYPVIRNVNYRIKAAGGSGDLTLPFSEFFTLGGMQEFPGLYERERFGRQMLLLTNELRYNFRWPLPIDMYFGGSYNIGSTWESSEDPIKTNDFLTSWSIYFALNSLFGPIRLAYGNLTGHRGLIYFSLGYDF